MIPGIVASQDVVEPTPDVTAPTITSSNTVSVAENVTLAKALTANETVTWSIVGGADQARFEISGSTLRWLSNGTKNFEAPDDADTNNTYIVTVRATDTALNTTDQTITATVTDADETAPTITSSNTASVAENATLAHALTADEAVTWSIIGGADQARFELSGSTLRWLSNGTKNFEAPDDADTNNTYVVTIRATDTALNTADQTITATVTDVDEGAAAPAWRSSNVIAGAVATSLALPYPAGIAANDILLVRLSSDVGTGTNLNTPTDFTAIGSEVDEGTTFVGNVFWKRATGSESGTLTISQSSGGGGSDVFMGTMHAISGCVASGDPIEDTDVAHITDDELTSGTVTTLGANRLIVQLWAISDNLVGDPTAPYTENYEITTGLGSDGAHAFCSAEKASAGVSDVDARTIAASTPMMVFTLALKPVGA